jgi:hypothetical protein
LQKFQQAFLKNAKRLGLGNWEVRFKLDDSSENDAAVVLNDRARQATVHLASDISRDESRDIDFLAAHEAVELLLGPARMRALDRFGSKDEMDAAFHVVVQCLLKLLGYGHVV